MFTPREVEMLDAWIERNDFANRSEAVRYLVRVGIDFTAFQEAMSKSGQGAAVAKNVKESEEA